MKNLILALAIILMFGVTIFGQSISVSPWKMYKSPEVLNLVDYSIDMGGQHGNPVVYNSLASIPPKNNSAWIDAPKDAQGKINFNTNSTLDCFKQVQFTYFRTFIDIPASVTLTSLTVKIGNVDDGARMMIFNSKYPSGTFEVSADGRLYGTNFVTDFTKEAKAGEVNTIVIVQFDDCRSGNTLYDLSVSVNGAPIVPSTNWVTEHEHFIRTGTYAETTTCPSLSTYNENFKKVGTATFANNEHTLTAAQNNQSGAIWHEVKLDLNKDFTVSASLYFGTKDTIGADGIAFVLQNNNFSSVAIGGSIGYKDIKPSMAIEFDTWQNSEFSDPVADHVGIRTEGDPKHIIQGYTKDFHILDNLEDGQWHPFSFKWDAKTKTFDVSVDGVKVFDKRKFDSYVQGSVFWGFTAATGGYNNLQKVKDILLEVCN